MTRIRGSPTPPYIKALADQGWDTFRLNRLREAESLSGTAARLARAARDLRAQGYRADRRGRPELRRLRGAGRRGGRWRC